MPEIMPFGRMQDKSVEQIALQDYKYFVYIMDNIEIRKHSLRERFNFVEHVVNNFKSKEQCVACDKPARYVSVYSNSYMNYKGSSKAYIYCSKDCFDNDPTGADPSKILLAPLKFRTAIASSKFDTNKLVKMMSECMGLRKTRKTKEYLEDFFDHCELWEPYANF